MTWLTELPRSTLIHFNAPWLGALRSGSLSTEAQEPAAAEISGRMSAEAIADAVRVVPNDQIFWGI